MLAFNDADRGERLHGRPLRRGRHRCQRNYDARAEVVEQGGLHVQQQGETRFWQDCDYGGRRTAAREGRASDNMAPADVAGVGCAVKVAVCLPRIVGCAQECAEPHAERQAAWTATTGDRP